jgi:ABC-type antimicrobial peptide transport system ATPase subunit
MINVDPILDFLCLAVWTAVLQHEEPVSVVLVSDSSGGKTSMLKKLICPITTFNTDLTTRDISTIISDKNKRIILLSDMQAIFVHKSSVVSLTLQALRNLLEEGIYNDPYSGVKVNRRMGIIAGIPPKEFYQFSNKFLSGGLNTRFLVFEYEYKKKTIVLIHDSIEDGQYHGELVSLPNLPEDGELRHIVIPSEIAKQCRNLAAILKRDDIGTRTHHHIRRMVMASAARSGRKEAIDEDYQLIEKYSDFLDPRRENTKKI